MLMKDSFVQEATALLKAVTIALVGIGAVEPSKLLASSGNVFSPQELKALSAKGAVGDICLRFFDAAGRPVSTPLNDRVISIDLDSLQRIDRVVGRRREAVERPRPSEARWKGAGSMCSSPISTPRSGADAAGRRRASASPRGQPARPSRVARARA